MPENAYTPNLHLTKVAANKINWSEWLNTNMTIIDAAFASMYNLPAFRGGWVNDTEYAVGQTVLDTVSGVIYQAAVENTSAASPTTFAQDRAANPSFWTTFEVAEVSRGPWAEDTAYLSGHFVIHDNQYAVCILAHTSSDSFNEDVSDGKWSILIDLEPFVDSGLPVLAGAGDSNKHVVANAGGTAYVLAAAATVLTNLGFSAFAQTLINDADAATFRTSIGAQASGSYQPEDTTLTDIAALTTTAFGISLLTLANAAALRSAASLGTVATLNSGTGAGEVPVLNGAAKVATSLIDVGAGADKILQRDGSGNYPAGGGAAITALNGSNIASGTVAKARGGTGAWKHAYVTIAAGVLTVQKSTGITSIVRDSDGKYTVTMTSAMSDALYRVQVTAITDSAATSGVIMTEDVTTPRTTTVFKLYGLDSIGAHNDPLGFSVDVFE